jgi:hypothetical protein
MRGRRPAQRERTSYQKVARNVGVRGEVHLIIVDESKGEQIRQLSRRFLSADEWENGLVVECAMAWAGNQEISKKPQNAIADMLVQHLRVVER